MTPNIDLRPKSSKYYHILPQLYRNSNSIIQQIKIIRKPYYRALASLFVFRKCTYLDTLVLNMEFLEILAFYPIDWLIMSNDMHNQILFVNLNISGTKQDQ